MQKFVINIVMPEYDYKLGLCRECILFNPEKKMCKKYNMYTQPDQCCKSWDDGNVEAEKQKQIQQCKDKNWDINF